MPHLLTMIFTIIAELFKKNKKKKKRQIKPYFVTYHKHPMHRS